MSFSCAIEKLFAFRAYLGWSNFVAFRPGAFPSSACHSCTRQDVLICTHVNITQIIMNHKSSNIITNHNKS